MTRFRAEPVSQHLSFTHRVCLNCQREFDADALVVIFFVEDEPVGFVCCGCVSSEARDLLRSGSEGTSQDQRRENGI